MKERMASAREGGECVRRRVGELVSGEGRAEAPASGYRCSGDRSSGGYPCEAGESESSAPIGELSLERRRS
jgi:hypothetical protein